jgi:hypothetical protein
MSLHWDTEFLDVVHETVMLIQETMVTPKFTFDAMRI